MEHNVAMQGIMVGDKAFRPWSSFEVIGKMITPFRTIWEVPQQPFLSRTEGCVELFPEYEEGLEDLEGFSHLILIYLFHRCSGGGMRVRSSLDGNLHGVFATREPNRPTPIGLSVVRQVRRRGRFVWVYGVDMLNGTPLVDIKPYVPAFDRRECVSIGWMRGLVPEGDDSTGPRKGVRDEEWDI